MKTQFTWCQFRNLTCVVRVLANNDTQKQGKVRWKLSVYVQNRRKADKTFFDDDILMGVDG